METREENEDGEGTGTPKVAPSEQPEFEAWVERRRRLVELGGLLLSEAEAVFSGMRGPFRVFFAIPNRKLFRFYAVITAPMNAFRAQQCLKAICTPTNDGVNAALRALEELRVYRNLTAHSAVERPLAWWFVEDRSADSPVYAYFKDRQGTERRT